MPKTKASKKIQAQMVSSGTPSKDHTCQAPVAHTCNPGYSGGRDQEDYHSKSYQANSSRDHILEKTKHTHKKPITKKKRAGGVTQDIGAEFKLQYHKKKNHIYESWA
jgi:hypothetical protein